MQDGGEASLGGRHLVEPGDQAAAVGGAEGERDDLVGEQRIDEPAGAALPGVRPRAAKYPWRSAMTRRAASSSDDRGRISPSSISSPSETT